MNRVKINLKNSSYFLFFGLSLALPMGIYTLTSGPSRIIANKAHNNHWSENSENFVQKIIIVVFCVLIFIASLYLTRYFIILKSNIKKYIIFGICATSLLTALYIFTFKPEILIVKSTEKVIIEKNTAIEFHFGSYPDEDKMANLVAEKYTAIISLLHPLVIPAEPVLMEKELKSAKKLRLKIISIPMLPWIIGNDSAVSQIKKLAHNAKGKYYVHCYLGKDRVNVFRNIIEKENKNIKINSHFTTRNLDTISRFERGNIYKLDEDCYLTPYPTDEEFFSFILNGKIKSVVSLLHSNKAENKNRRINEEKIMTLYNQSYYNIPILESDSDLKIKEAVAYIKKLPKPIIIHEYSSESIISNRFRGIFQEKSKNTLLK
ncbi:MAG: hypothetical protein ABI549_03075 [Flavobacterium sp.]|uniref:hypothetical protein n=1 Tax=Flavobacterium sp. TaxID=239 RepID=UPI003264CC68